MKSSTNRALVAKKQSTSFAQVATNLLNLLQGYTKGIRFVAVLTMLLIVGIGQAWGQTTTTYTFSSKNWEASPANWTSGKDGNQMQSGRGIQVTTGSSGANATSPKSFTNVSKVVVTYSTNASNGAGDIKIKIGTNTEVTQSVTKTGGTTDRTLTYNFSPNQTGSVKVTVTCSTNSIYIKSIAITEAASAVNYTVTWMVNGETYTTGSPSTSVSGGGKVTTLPTNPTLDCSGKVFAGWTKTPIDGTTNTKPSVLFTAAENSPEITEPTTFHAVFATATGGGSTTDTYDWESTSTGNWTVDSNITRTASQGVSSSYAGKISTAKTYVTYTKKVPVTEFSFDFKRTSNNSNYNVYIETSTDNSNWSAAATYAMNSFNNGSYTSKSQTFDGKTELYVRFYCYNTTATRYVDNVSITYSSSSYSDYTTQCATQQTYSVTWNPNGGNWSGNTNNQVDYYEKDESIITPAAPTRDGYTFNSWDPEPANEMGTENLTYTAQWTANTITITWDQNYTDCPVATTSTYIYDGEEIAMPAEPIRTGYKFNGWFTAASSGTQITEVGTTNKPTEDVTYYAQWAKLHTITWMVGSNPIHTKEVANATGVTQTPDEPANTAIGSCANTFMGWSEQNLGSAEGQSAPADLCTAEQMKDKYTSVTDDKTFYAVFASAEGGNDYVQISSENDLVAGSKYLIVGNSSSTYRALPVDKATSLTYVYPSSSKISNPAGELIWTLEGTADQWKIKSTSKNKYLQISGGNLTFVESTALTFAVTISSSKFTFTSSASSGNKILSYYHNGNCFNAYNSANTVYIYKQDVSYSNYVTQCCTDWTPTLTYSKTTLDASTNETATPTITGNTHGAPVSFVSSKPSVLTVDANNGEITAVGAGKATITATWDATGVYCGKSITTEEITVNGNFLVTFHANDGSGNTTTQQIPSNTATALKANTFQRDGYTFQGWATSASGAKEYDDGHEVTLSTSGLDLHAVWQVKAYEITIGTITGNGTITTSPANSANCDAQVTITVTPAAHYTLTSVTVTRDDNSQTVDVLGNKFTMPASDVTITAVFNENENFAINYAIPTGGGTLTDNAPTSIYIDGSITLPGIKDGTISSEYSCERFIGWTTLSTYENANGQKPNPFYNTGASLSGITQNTTLYAVYSRAGEGASGTVELTCTDVSTWKSNVLSGNNNTYGTVTTRTAADGSVWETNGQILNAGGIDLKENYYIQIPTLPGPATSITMKVSQGNIGSGEDACTDNVASPTSRAFYFRSADNGSNLFTSETTSSRSRTINITEGNYTTGYIINGEGTSHVHSVTVAYGSPNIISTSLNCSNDIDEFTITYNLNQSSVVSGTQITGVCESGVTYKFSEITEYTICSAPRANGYQLVGWNTQANGKGGLTYTPGQVITSVPLSTLTLYAQWAPVVSLSDVGNISTVNATTVGGSVTLPDGENGCDPYEFIGWTEVYPSWNETAQLPTLVANPYTPTAPITLYAVYTQRTTAGAFTDNGAGGVYEIWVNNSAKNHMSGQRNDSYNLYTKEYWDSYKTGSNGAPFIITKIAENTYTIQNAEGHYIAKHSNDTKLDIESEWQNLDRYKWTVSAGTNGSWRFTNKAVTTHALIYYNDYFRLYSASNVTNGSTSYYDLELTPVESAVYYSAPSCGDYAIHFYTHGGEFVQGVYAYPTTVTEGLNGTVETKFPSATLNGYTFVGWKENAPQDELTDNSPEGDTSAEPYGLKKPGDDLITTTRREFHAVYYYYDELQDIDFSAPFTTGMYAEVNGTKYFLSGTPDRGTMSSTTDCGYVSEVTITPGTGANAGKYKITVNDVGMAPEAEETDLVAGTAWWTITETSAGSGEYKISGADERNIMLLNSSFGHYSYNVGSSYGAGYYYPKFGNCREHHWASDPKRKPSIILSSSGPLTITSAAGQTIKSINKLFVGATRYETQTKIYLTCDVDGVGLLHEDGTALSSDANGEYLTTTAEGELASTNLILTYSPTITTDGIETVTITAQDAGNQATANRLAEVRHLPATFAIVAKVGNLWYALPSQGLNSTDALVGYPIEVDNIADPTAVTAVPENADWSLRQVYAASHSDAQKDRFKLNGANIMFENNASPAKMLNASSSDNYLLTNAEYDNYKQSDNQGLYEWTPTTTDLETYQLTNEQRDRTLSVNIATVFGVHAQNVATNNLRFLPITGRYTPAALQVVEWKENSVVIMYNGDPAQTASVSVNGGEAQTTTLSAAQRDIAVYELKATGLAANPTQRLSITIGTEKLLLPIPYIVNSNTTDATLTSNNKTLAAVSDLVVLNGKTFTADAATASKYTFRNVTIYGGGKLVIPSEKGFGVASLTLRAGGITDAGKYDYVYPQFELRGTFTNSAAKINYDYITDYDHWYHLVLPFSGDLGTIKYPTEFYGANVAANNTGSWQIKRYAGEIRATGNYNAWVDIETEGETSTIAGQGYIFWGAPKKVSVNGGASTRQKWGIQRITMSVKASDAETEKADKILTGLSSYANVPNNSGKDNDQGWNLVGNPYMVNLTDMATTGLHACKLVEVIDPATGKWNGKWKWNDETNIRYLTIPSDHFDTYTAKTVAQTVPLVAGRAFFVQLDGEANGITFATANRASLMPALLAENNDKPVDIETGIILSNETLQDEVNFWIKDGKTNNYEYNADYPKTPNNNHFNIYGVHTNGDLSWVATSPEYAAESMPIGYQVPAAGTFTLSVSETYYSENLQALFVTDHEASPEVTTNLVDEDYTFYVNQAQTNNTRFTVSIILKPDTENTPTGVDNINTKANQPIKFLYQDKIYILRNGMIYDTTGKQVITINK